MDIVKPLTSIYFVRSKASDSVKNLGVWLDMHLNMQKHISNTCKSSFYMLYNLRHIRRYLSQQDTETLDCLVFPCRSSRAKGIHWYTYSSIRNAARESWAQRYRTIKAAKVDHPGAQRTPEYDLEGGER